MGDSTPYLEAQGDPAAVDIQPSFSFTEEAASRREGAGILQAHGCTGSGLTPRQLHVSARLPAKAGEWV